MNLQEKVLAVLTTNLPQFSDMIRFDGSCLVVPAQVGADQVFQLLSTTDLRHYPTVIEE